ncbi:MAG: CPBP family intramembrane metalloprotease [Gammaproteobacteria bacterium]|nr:CPBP family intramembrane metalloprotease [Gammaproteobacteria bacterium]
MPFDPASDLFGALRGYGPTLAALLTAAVVYGRKGLTELWRRLKMWRIPPWLLALAILGPMLASLVLLLFIHIAGVNLTLASQGVPLPKLIIIFVFFAIVDGPVGEEIGWRGFLLPRLLEKYGAIHASILLGIVWFLWHIPLYAATDKVDLNLAFFSSYLLNNVALSFLHAWFFLRSGGSALLAIIFHTACNYAVYLAVTFYPSIEQSPLTQQLYVGILVFAAIFAGLSMWRNPAQGQRAAND